jgi:hypothetical protein
MVFNDLAIRNRIGSGLLSNIPAAFHERQKGVDRVCGCRFQQFVSNISIVDVQFDVSQGVLGAATAFRGKIFEPAVGAESAWLVSEWSRRIRDRLDAEHIEKFACAEDLGYATCTERQHATSITRDQVVGVAGLSHGKEEIIGRIGRSLDRGQAC